MGQVATWNLYRILVVPCVFNSIETRINIFPQYLRTDNYQINSNKMIVYLPGIKLPASSITKIFNFFIQRKPLNSEIILIKQ